MKTTPLPIIAEVSRIVTLATDRLTGDRSNVPLLVGFGVKEALERYGIKSQIVFGSAAWIEIFPNHQIAWSGCWGDHIHLWVTTEFGEVVDLNTSVSKRKAPHSQPDHKPLYSPPILWTKEVPSFYRYKFDGVAELEITDPMGQKWMAALSSEIAEKCNPAAIESLLNRPEAEVAPGDLDFPNEPILCSNRKLLDDSHQNFLFFDRAISVSGIPAPPF